MVSTLFVATLALMASTSAASAPFKCQHTIDLYNSFVNTGNFQAAANQTLTEDVRYIIPGPVKICPYCGLFNGRAEVVGLFVDGFLGHFTIVNPLVNLRQIGCADCGPAGVPRLMDFNQESFVTNPAKTQGGVPRYFSVPVIHDFLFDDRCMITQMTLFQDPYTVVQVYAGHPAPTAPVMPFVVFAAPPDSFASTQNVSDFQVFPSEGGVPSAQAVAHVEAYYRAVAAGDGGLTPAQASDFFMAQDYTVPQIYSSLLVPGDPSVEPFAGYFFGPAQIAQAHQLRAAAVRENVPLADPASLHVAAGGSVAFSWTLEGKATATGTAYSCAAVDYFQVVNTHAGLRIGRMTRFFDTYNVTMALTKGELFPQYA